MRNNILKKTIFASAIGATALFAAVAVSAQNTSEEYREWQAAQRRAQEEYRDYLRTRSRADYRDWQQAQRIAQQEYAEYRRVARSGNRYTNRRGGSRWYRVNGGYRTDSRGVELLKQAVNRGYQQGYNAGVRDRRFGRDVSYYRDDSTYRSGSMGYQSYVARDQYQRAFQRGFERGYEDGINSRQLYGYRSGSRLNILGNVLNSILSIAEDDDS